VNDSWGYLSEEQMHKAGVCSIKIPIKKNMLWFVLVTAAHLFQISFAKPLASPNPFTFITRQGTELREENSNVAFKFVSLNIPNLQALEDDDRFVLYYSLSYQHSFYKPFLFRKMTTTLQPPTPFEQEDALSSIARLNGRVTRFPTLAICNSSDPFDTRHFTIISDPTLEIPPNWKFVIDSNPPMYANEDLFVALDSALALASKYKIR
jgi:hypothetical protein